MATGRDIAGYWWERWRPSAPEAEVGASERARLFRLHGAFSLAYATMDVEHVQAFGDARGFIAYGQSLGFTFALGDPVAPREAWAALVARFIGRFGRPSFIQVSLPLASLLAERGYRVTPFGLDTVLALSSYTFAGKEKEGIRYASNWLAKRGYTFAERSWSDEVKSALVAISREWRGDTTYKSRKMRFLNRRLPEREEPGTRIFFLDDPAGKPVAFVIFDPLSDNGRTIGYVTALKRRTEEAGSYAELGLTRHAIDVFRQQGLREVRLGLSPLLVEQPSPYRDDPLLRAAFRRLFASRWVNRNSFNLEGQATFKRRFRGQEEPMYVATKGGLGLFKILAVLRLSKIV